MCSSMNKNSFASFLPLKSTAIVKSLLFRNSVYFSIQKYQQQSLLRAEKLRLCPSSPDQTEYWESSLFPTRLLMTNRQKDMNSGFDPGSSSKHDTDVISMHHRRHRKQVNHWQMLAKHLLFPPLTHDHTIIHIFAGDWKWSRRWLDWASIQTKIL